jgi:hypothetical protein
MLPYLTIESYWNQIDSASEATMDVPDVMRRVGRELETVEVEAVDEVKALGNELHAVLERLGSSRELSLAKTKLQEAVMWATHHITAPKG